MSFNFIERVRQQKNQALYRQRRLITIRKENFIGYTGKAYLNFCSNDYLGLSLHPKVIAAFKQGSDDYGVGSGASQLVSGHYTPHDELEKACAEFLQREAALVFSSGYLANVGVVNALVNRNDAIFADRLNHASLVDAAQLSRATLYRYAHNSNTHLEERIERATQAKKLIISDSVFSMRGDSANVVAMADIAAKYHALLMLDDSHGMGVLGKNGRGVVEYTGLPQEQVPILMSSFGKALGGMGAVVSGSRTLIEHLLQFARTFTYNTGIPPAMAYAMLASLQVIQEENWRREKLFYLINFFKKEADRLELSFLSSETPIQSFLIGSNEITLSLSQFLLEKGYFVFAVRPPTVPPREAGLRITLNCMHTEKQIQQLLGFLKKYCETIH